MGTKEEAIQHIEDLVDIIVQRDAEIANLRSALKLALVVIREANASHSEAAMDIWMSALGVGVNA